MRSHVKKIFAGEYEIDFVSDQPVIVDIGANVGAFARWASARWMNSRILCFEPIKDNFEMLKKNTSDMPNVQIYNVAIGSSDRKQKMYYGKHNEGEASMFLAEQQVEDGEEVDVISAGKIPKCHILKIDTEGAEIEIIENLEIEPAVYLIEYHSEENRRKIDDLLRDKYSLIAASSEMLNYGIVKYALSALLKKSDPR
jgi:FkbM family methyltransferase